MPTKEDLLQRSVYLKRELLEFAKEPRFAPDLSRALSRDATALNDEGALANFLDRFMLQHRLADGRTVVDHFVAERPDLPELDRELLLGWKDVVDGIFAVHGGEGEARIVLNLVDELTYRVYSNAGPGVLAKLSPESFFIGRLVPLGDDWMVSGVMTMFPSSARVEIYRSALELAQRVPKPVFRNPEKLEQARALQREERQEFIEFFGADTVVLPRSELAERMRAYYHYRLHERRDEQGQSAADRAQQAYGVVPQTDEVEYPDELLEAETVGLMYDEVDGLAFLAAFDLVEETFRRSRARVGARTFGEGTRVSGRPQHPAIGAA